MDKSSFSYLSARNNRMLLGDSWVWVSGGEKESEKCWFREQVGDLVLMAVETGDSVATRQASFYGFEDFIRGW
jgi:hypothetical protein